MLLRWQTFWVSEAVHSQGTSSLLRHKVVPDSAPAQCHLPHSADTAPEPPLMGSLNPQPLRPACPLHPRHTHYRVRPPTEPFNHPECKATPQAQAMGRENRTCSCALMSVMGQMGIQIEMRITRQIRPWQNSCSLASGLQDSQICAYLSNGRACKTPPQRAPRRRSCSSGQRPHSFPRPQTCPHPRLHLLMEFAWNLRSVLKEIGI